MERKEYKFCYSGLLVKDVDETKGIIEGYFAHFESLDSDGDIFAKSAFDKTIKEKGPNGKKQIKHLLDHDQPCAMISELEADSVGLRYVSQLVDYRKDIDIIKLFKSGIISEHSVGFKTVKRDKFDKRIISEANLWEGSSLRKWGANSNTPLLGIKSEGSDNYDPEYMDFVMFKLKRLKESYNSGTFTDDCFINIIIPNLKEFTAEAQNIIKSVDTLEADIITSQGYNPTKEEIISHYTKHISI